MARNDQWWLRTQDEVFGPVTRDNLLEWARMGRIQPGQEVSDDGETWRPATEVAFLDMRWSIDIGDGTPRGPFNRQAAQALLASGRLPRGSTLVEVAPAFEERDAVAAEEKPVEEAAGNPVRTTPGPEPVPAAELEELKRQIETLQAGLEAAEARAAEAERKVGEARREAKTAVKAADVAEARLAAVQAESEQKDAELARARAAAEEQAVKEAAKDTALAERDSALAAKDSELAAKDSEIESAKRASAEREETYENRIKSLSDEIRRLPPSAHLAADAQAAMYALMKDEADELSCALEAEQKEAEALRQYRRARIERLLARRQEILRRIGTDAEDMTQRALRAHPEDPRTVHMRQELDALRILQERTALEAERKVRDLSAKLRDSVGEANRLRQQSVDLTAVYHQLHETREKLLAREKELMETRQKAEAERQQYAAAQQALLTRLSSLEMGMPGTTQQSREARNVRLAPWMGLKK